MHELPLLALLLFLFSAFIMLGGIIPQPPPPAETQLAYCAHPGTGLFFPCRWVDDEEVSL